MITEQAQFDMDKDHKYLRINWENDKHVIEGFAEKQIIETFINDCINKWDFQINANDNAAFES